MIKKRMIKKCQCESRGRLMIGMESLYDPIKKLPYVDHEPGECECTNNIRLYLRNGKKVFLCSNCVLGEEEVKE